MRSQRAELPDGSGFPLRYNRAASAERQARRANSGTQGPFDYPDESGQTASQRDRQGDRTQSAKPHSLSILRHDVDLLPEYALTLAKLENKLGIFGTYFFRIVQESFEEKIIREIAEMGHEIGSHYEELDLVRKKIPEGMASHKVHPVKYAL